jgi:parallel beta-helix repeat protein
MIARIAVAALLISAMAAPGAALATTRVVDDDGHDCPSAAYTTIQSAVDAAAAGDTVLVCAGDYAERVAVTQPLRLLGAKHGQDARARTLGDPGESVVRSPDPFTLGADGIVIDGFSVVVELDEEGEGRGIGVSGVGQRIVNNLFEDSLVSGIIIYSATGEQPVTIRRNHFRGRLGIAADSESIAHNLVIAQNRFLDASILLVNGGHSDLLISGNVLRYDPTAPSPCVSVPQECRPGIFLSATTDATVIGNRIAGSGDEALGLSGNSALTVQDNVMANGRGIGIRVDGAGTGVSVIGNQVNGFRGAGIAASHLDGALIEGNDVQRSRIGIAVADTAASQVRSNTANDNRVAGIDVRHSSGNTFDANQARGNVEIDCRDGSRGSESFGTANTWTGNAGDSALPEGLCSP